MKFYRSKGYQQMINFNQEMAYNTFYMLSDEERFRLADKIRQLEVDLEEKLQSGYLKPALTKARTMRVTTKSFYQICKKDLEAIDFLKRMCWFNEFPDSVALDPTKHQINTIVNKMLFKIYKPKGFIQWMEVYLDPETVEPHHMRKWMDKKRKIFYTLQKEGLIDSSKKLPY